MCLHRDDDPGFEVDLISIWLNNYPVHVPDHQIVVESRHHIIVEHSLVDFVPCSPERCHVNTNDEGDSFVGVKADTDDAMIYFPIGYQLPANDDDLRADINNLFYVLAAFMKED